MNRLLSSVFLCAVVCFLEVHGFGCISSLCKGRELKYRSCDQEKCGQYNSKRASGQFVKAIDIECAPGDAVLAPFDAEIEFYSHYRDGSKWDYGLKFKGQHRYMAYSATILHISPKKTSGVVKKGEVVGHALNILETSPMKGKLIQENSGNFVQFQLMGKNNEVLNPASHFFDCSCTGQICETNEGNDIIGGYKSLNEWDGFELLCKDKGKKTDPDYLPLIYSPIDGKQLGRIRSRPPDAETHKYECSDEGVIITGAGKWNKFEARIYNVRFTTQPGNREIKVGEAIAKRLDCPGIDSVFIELRYYGKPINFRRQLVGQNCTLPSLESLKNLNDKTKD